MEPLRISENPTKKEQVRHALLAVYQAIEKVDAEFFDVISKHDQKILLSLLNNLVTKAEVPE